MEILNKRSLLKGERREILDVSCGSGVLVKHLLKVHNVWGIDLSTDVADYLGKVALRAGSSGKFLTLDLSRYAIPLESLSFDIVVCSHVLEHLPNEQELLSDMKRLLYGFDGAIGGRTPFFSPRQEIQKGIICRIT